MNHEVIHFLRYSKEIMFILIWVTINKCNKNIIFKYVAINLKKNKLWVILDDFNSDEFFPSNPNSSCKTNSFNTVRMKNLNLSIILLTFLPITLDSNKIQYPSILHFIFLKSTNKFTTSITLTIPRKDI